MFAMDARQVLPFRQPGETKKRDGERDAVEPGLGRSVVQGGGHAGASPQQAPSVRLHAWIRTASLRRAA